MNAAVYNNILKETIERIEAYRKTLDPVHDAQRIHLIERELYQGYGFYKPPHRTVIGYVKGDFSLLPDGPEFTDELLPCFPCGDDFTIPNRSNSQAIREELGAALSFYTYENLQKLSEDYPEPVLQNLNQRYAGYAEIKRAYHYIPHHNMIMMMNYFEKMIRNPEPSLTILNEPLTEEDSF
ncbi:MAG: hypothetical protein Q4C20_14930 [Erysipelotrichaceae bacterium]|nr:hypothetical protein [Erysipelotrichaceae bacterium]